MIPLFFLFVFGLLQGGQLGVAAIVMHYSASTIARKAAEEDKSATGVGSYSATLNKLMVGGMKADKLWACYVPGEDAGALTPTIVVNATAKISAFPLVGEFLKVAIGNAYAGTTLNGSCTAAEPPSLGPFYFVATPPYSFVVRGKAMARMNYHP